MRGRPAPSRRHWLRTPGVVVPGAREAIDEPQPGPPTASFSDVPATRGGSSGFTFRVAFGEDLGIGYATMPDDAFETDEGDATRARRVDRTPPFA